MKISELAAASGESIPTIKYYIREGLLAPGISIARNQANYEASHLQRLELIRTLCDDLQMSVEKVGEVLRSASQGGPELLRSGLAAAQSAQHSSLSEERASPELELAWKTIFGLKDELDWEIDTREPSGIEAAEALSRILRLLPEAQAEKSLVEYAKVMKEIADQEIPDDFDPEADPFGSFRFAILGTYLFEPLILALRRMAHAQRTAEIMKKRDSCE